MEWNDLIVKLKLDGAIKTKKVENAFKKVDRANFVSEYYKQYAYLDTPLPIGEDQTISAPHIVAIMTEELDVKSHQKILEIGGGSGYQSAMILEILNGNGRLHILDISKELVKLCKKNLEKIKWKNYKIYNRNGWNGLKEEKPFDRIIVAADASETPKALLEQLKMGGIMIIPVNDKLLKIKKTKKDYEEKFLCSVRFVPLIE